ncbi:uncharacterized protein LOC113505310 [Trichoplusia ni]|uniref:Uncharacterized protein LOC113505310 n=1 Tax=Trichoplusia ni TaxID=7111 RepID=A0A7E5WSF5_TRINI|nr:uncharacterized protein LOC113505310 [Trichoplusia ni]
MKLLWMFVVLPTVLGQVGFGRSYLKNSRLCHQWTCISTKLGLSDSLPTKDQAEEALRRLLPTGPWQDVVVPALDNCYGNRTRRYTNTCPGQALMHCVVDQMIENCPESSWRKDDGCSPVSSLAGLKHMFAQSRYADLEKNLPKDRRPGWFLKNYFDSKCCDLPMIFNTSVLEHCGFVSFMSYDIHDPRYAEKKNDELTTSTIAPVSDDATKVHFVDFNQNQPMPPAYEEANDITDPLDCCEMTSFIQPNWRSECGFQLSWGGSERLVVSNNTPNFYQTTEAPDTTTTVRPDVKDLMLVPHSCEKEECVFRQLGIIHESGALNIDGYMKMLLNFTDAHPAWSKAKGRVLTKCLLRPVPREYDAGCEINNILSCTLDVLTENCPYKQKTGVCKHGKHDAGCQISSSKFRPKNRRPICLLPELIHRDHLTQCGLESLYKAEHIPVFPKQRKHGWFANRTIMCKVTTPPTSCLMNKMGVMNKYNFIDYFKMKDRIRQFSFNQVEWAALLDVYMSAFTNVPMYGEYCNSQKKLLNVLDAMLMTCPITKRKNTAQCNKIFMDMIHTTPVDNQNITREKLDEIMKHYHHVFMPNQPTPSKFGKITRKKHSKIIKNPIFQFGLLDSQNAPSVNVIDLKPVPTANTLILRPVYMRPNHGKGPLHHDAMLRGGMVSLPAPQKPLSTLPTYPEYRTNLLPPRRLVYTKPTVASTTTDVPIPLVYTTPEAQSTTPAAWEMWKPE